MPVLPRIVQGGMGVGVSSPALARAVASRGQLGVVSGTAVAVTLARRLQRGDADGAVREALGAFPSPEIAGRIMDRYWREPATAGGFRSVPMPRLDPPRSLVELTVAGAFVEVWLARQGHAGPVGINLLEKIQLPTLPTLYGAMLAGVDVVFMGAGIPARIPRVLDELAEGRPVALPVTVTGAGRGEVHESRFDPSSLAGMSGQPALSRPRFVAVVASNTLARHLVGVASGPPDGFVVELPVAGGHNAPPRGRGGLSGSGEPVYGPRDEVDLEAIGGLGLPFWVAGGRADPASLQDALDHGAVGVQVGTAFAFCDESGLPAATKRQVLAAVRAGRVQVRTDPLASPTGYPFKVVLAPGTVGHDDVYAARPRRCDLGYLRDPFVRPDGRIGYRCAAEPVEDWAAKGGDPDDTAGRRCLCNGLVSAIDLGQTRVDGTVEPPLLTAGDDLLQLGRFLTTARDGYTAADVIDHVLAPTVTGQDMTPAT